MSVEKEKRKYGMSVGAAREDMVFVNSSCVRQIAWLNQVFHQRVDPLDFEGGNSRRSNADGKG